MKKLLFSVLCLLSCVLCLPAATNGAGAGVVDDYTARVVLGQGTAVNFYATNAAAGATTIETAVTLTKSAGTAATSTAVSYVVTANKRFRITSITIGCRGHATGTVQLSTFSLRLNTAGAVITSTTPVIWQASIATIATNSVWDSRTYHFPDGFEILGDGTLQIGVTANATYTTNAPTWFVNITGYEY
jgi:hypothetical protein